MPRPRSLPALLTALGVGIVVTLAGCSSTTGGAPTVTTTAATTPSSIPETTTTSEPSAAEGKEFFVYAPVEGDCIDLRATGDGGSATTRDIPEEDATPRSTSQLILRLDCQLPHQYEVIAVVDPGLPKQPPPDDLTLVAKAKQLCIPAFAGYIGTAYQDSELELGWVLPSAEQRNRGVQQIGCLAYDPDGKLTSSARGTGR